MIRYKIISSTNIFEDFVQSSSIKLEFLTLVLWAICKLVMDTEKESIVFSCNYVWIISSRKRPDVSFSMSFCALNR